MLTKKKTYNLTFGKTRASELLPDGEYLCKIVKSEVRDSKAGNDTYFVNLEVQNKDYKGKTLLHTCAFTFDLGRDALQDLLFAVGIEAVGSFVFNPDKLLGKMLLAKVVTKTVEGTDRNNVVAVSSPEMQDDEDDEDVTPVKKKKVVEEEEEEEEEEEVKPKKKKIIEPEDDEDEEEVKPVKKKKVIIEEEEEEEEEEEAPKPKLKRRV
jgi:Protein of unknown function (DUF669)